MIALASSPTRKAAKDIINRYEFVFGGFLGGTFKELVKMLNSGCGARVGILHPKVDAVGIGDRVAIYLGSFQWYGDVPFARSIIG